MKKLIAYCGLDCEKCEARIATLNNDNELRVKVSKEWSAMNGVEITPEMINCEGCRMDGVKFPFCESLCPIKKCASEKGFETCGNCADMESCEKVGMVIGNNDSARKNLEKTRKAFLYIHGKGGNADEADHYKKLFPESKVWGLDYKGFTPWVVGREISVAVKELKKRYENVVLIANSIGAFFALRSDICDLVERAYFISPLVDMEALILAMLKAENVTEEELKERGYITTFTGEVLTRRELEYVRENPIKWSVPTHILYGQKDALIGFDTIKRFSEKFGATVTVMQGGEHWFHTDEQIAFLDEWILSYENGD